MSEIALRTYVEQLDSLIERKQIDEVLAHCRHILSLYPKHLDTYRMLGKALLEKGRHTDAADIFQRVLSVAPDDFIAHVGMSIVREDEANLDSAIWHMERAFENSPSNGAIQQEVCRLYGRRDGVTPPKARLTRGALARMYSQGGLFLQAEAELKSALSEDSDRIDLLTVLARVYWQSGQPAEAAQVCAAILQKLPYSFEANRILSGIFREQDRAAEAAAYRLRLEALDPYEAFVTSGQNGHSARKVDAGRITLQRLEYVPGADDGGSPDWLTSIGAKFEEPQTKPAEATPEWLNNDSEATAPIAPADVPMAAELPDWLRDLQPLPPSAAISPEPAVPGAPDWLRDLGLGSSPLPADQPENEDLPDWLKTATGPLPAEAVPDWMLPAFKEPSEPAEALPSAESDEELPSWLAGLTSAEPLAESPAETDSAASDTADPLGAWLGGAPPARDEELPDWMRPAEDQPGAAVPEGTAQAGDQPEPILPALAFGLADTLIGMTPAAETPASADDSDVEAWLEPAAASTEAVVETPSGLGALEPVEDLPDWLRAAANSDPTAASLPEWMRSGPIGEAGPPEAPSASSPMPQPAELDDETLAWLQTSAAASAPAEADEPPWAESVPADLAQAPVDQPLGSAEIAAPAEVPSESALVSEPAELAAPLDDSLPDWLRAPEGSLQTPASPEVEELTSPIAQVDDVVPDWLRAPDASALPPSPPELPEWLRVVAATAPLPDALANPPSDSLGVSGEPPSPAELELPGYLQPASADAIARSEQPFRFDDDTDDEEFYDEPDEPDLVLPAEIPAWLQALAPIAPDPTPAVAELPAAEPVDAPLLAGAPAYSDPVASVEGDTPAWLADLGTGSAQAETPPWLAEITGQAVEVPPTESLVVPASEADLSDQPAVDLPPWAQAEAPGPTDTIASWLQSRSAPQPAVPAPAEPMAERDEPAPDAVPDMPDLAQAEAAALSAAEPEGQVTSEASPDLPPWAQIETPGATDTIVSWLSAKSPVDDVPAWMSSAGEAAVEAEPAEAAAEIAAEGPQPEAEIAAGEIDEDEALRWLEGLAAQQGARPEELITAPEDRPIETPAWIAAQQGAEIEAPSLEAEAALGEPESAEVTPESDAALPDWLRAPEAQPATPAWLAEALGEPAPASQLEPETLPAETPVAQVPSAEAPSLEAWLGQMEQAMPPEPLADTAPTKPRRPPAEAVAPEPEPVTEMSAVAEPMSAEPDLAEMDADEALRWLEGLAERQGADPDALITAPEERTTETPAWIAAIAAEAEVAAPEPAIAEASFGADEHVETELADVGFVDEAPEPALAEESYGAEEPLEPELAEAEAALSVDLAGLAAMVPAEPEGLPPASAPVEQPPPVTELEAEDEAMRWLEGLAARQGAQADELITAPEERLTETPAWILADAEQEPEPAPLAEPEPADSFAQPEWLRAEPPVEAAPEPAVMEASAAEPETLALPAEAPAPEPFIPVPPPSAPPTRRPETGDLGRLSRLAERLAETRRAREAEIEARFAEQRAEQEAARRLVQERMESKRVEAEAVTTGPLAAEAAPALVAQRTPSTPAPSPDYAAEAERYTAWIASGQHVDQAIRELETMVNQHKPTAPVLRVLGDAYVRQDRLGEALDAYRMALERL
jgi:tetratricopeptide (TPR) repeat protein